MFRVTVVLIAMFAVSAFAEDRKNNSAPKLDAFPKSQNARFEKKLWGLIEKTAPFADKKILKVSLVNDWGPLERDGNMILTSYCSAAVAVLDPENNKCWAWREVHFKKQQDGKVWYDSANGNWINEIDCALVRK